MEDKEVQTLGHREFGELSAELIEHTGGLRFRARGGSMAPEIRDGDVLTLEKTDADDLRVGDVVMIRTESGSLLAHRIIHGEGGMWTTCGDALNIPDTPFRAGQLIGRVTAVERRGVARKLSPKWGRFMVKMSRRGTALPGRILKKLLRACA